MTFKPPFNAEHASDSGVAFVVDAIGNPVPPEWIAEKLNALQPAALPTAPADSAGERERFRVQRPACADCGLPYTDDGWADFVVADDVWAKLTEHDPAALLCACCMVRRAHRLGIEAPGRFTSGPFCARPPAAGSVLTSEQATKEIVDSMYRCCGIPEIEWNEDGSCGFGPCCGNPDFIGPNHRTIQSIIDRLTAAQPQPDTARQALDMLLLCGEPELSNIPASDPAARCRALIDGLIEQRRRAAAAQPQAAEGFVLVPAEPTRQILDAMEAAYTPFGEILAAYDALVAAAPTPQEKEKGR